MCVHLNDHLLQMYFYSCFIAGEVLFNCNYPEDPPDFIFGSEDVDFFPNIENIKVSVYGSLKTA